MTLAQELIKAGVPQGPKVGMALREVVSLMESHGQITQEAAVYQIAQKYRAMPVQSKLSPKADPAPLKIALPPPQTGEEAANFANVIDNMRGILRIPVAIGGAVMPDACPAGPGITVGGVVATADAIIPSAHSADICCSMCSTFFVSNHTPQVLMDMLEGATHFGSSERNLREKPVISARTGDIPDGISGNRFLRGFDQAAIRHFATQGDGNHFASIGRVQITRALINELYESGRGIMASQLAKYEGQFVYTLTTHHGSRVLGALVYKRGQEVARKMTAEIADGIPQWGVWIPGSSPEGQEYWQALEFIRLWTEENHRAIHDTFASGPGVNRLGTLFNEHNFVWKSPHHKTGVPIYYHGKGATPAWRNQLEIIPLNMGAPILLVKGSDNKDFYGFAPHGAGRNMSRTALIKPFKTDARGVSLRDATKIVADQTEGLDIRWYNGKPDISESPFAYKAPDKITQEIESYDLARVIAKIEPVGCIMAGDTYRNFKRGKNGNKNLPEGTRDGVPELSAVLGDEPSEGAEGEI